MSDSLKIRHVITSIAMLIQFHLSPERPVDDTRVAQHERHSDRAMMAMSHSVLVDEAAFQIVRLLSGRGWK